MNKRIALWALAGEVIACLWVLLSALVPPYILGQWGHWMIVSVTAPASLLGRSFAMKYYSFILLNAAAYALIGLAIEPFLRLQRFRH